MPERTEGNFTIDSGVVKLGGKLSEQDLQCVWQSPQVDAQTWASDLGWTQTARNLLSEQSRWHVGKTHSGPRTDEARG